MNIGGKTGAIQDGTVITSFELDYVPGEGWTVNYNYGGIKTAVEEIGETLIPQGYDFEIGDQGPYHALSATRQNKEGDEQSYTDKFRIKGENVTKSIWTLEQVDQEMNAWVAAEILAGNSTARVEDYKKIITDALVDDTGGGFADLELELPSLLYPAAHAVYEELGRGADSYEAVYFVLSRARVVGPAYNQKLALKNTSVIYTTAELFSVFGIPAFVHILMPQAPAITPANSRWGWRSRAEEVRWIEGRKVEFTQDFAYAAWSTNIYSTYSP